MSAISSESATVERLAVVIAVYGAPPELRQQLAALRADPAPGPWEVVLVDNGGGDLTAVVADYVAGDWLRIVDATDVKGQAAALNRGVAVTSADALLFLDADDEIAPGYVATMWRALERSPFVAARLDCDALNAPWVRASRPPTQVDGLGSAFGFLPSAAGCAIGLRRFAFDLVSGFDPTIPVAHDVDMSWRLQLAGIPATFVPDAVLRYRYRADVVGIFRQGRGYGHAGVVLYARYRGHGMPRRHARSAARFHLAALWRAARIRSKSDLAAAAFLLGYRVGLFRGSIRLRVRYL